MRIDKLTLSNFRGFEHLELELHPNCTVLAGVNGSGKSSVLDALSVAIGSWFLGFDTVSPRNIVNNEVRRALVEIGEVSREPLYPVRVEAAGEALGQAVSWARELRRKGGSTTYGEAAELRELSRRAQTAIKGEDKGLQVPVLAYYGPGRLWTQKRASAKKRSELGSRTDGYRDCLDPASNHKLFSAWMEQRTLAMLQKAMSRSRSGIPFEIVLEERDPLLLTVRRTATRCIDDAKDLKFDVGKAELQVVFKDEENLPFSLMSDGYRNLVALTADLAWRAVRLNPQSGYEAPQEATGVVLIDEIELHLHPAWQRTVLPRLCETFPKIQFVVTTHSPQVLSSVPAEQIRFLGDDGQAHRVGFAEGLDTNTILRELMGVEERPTETIKRLAKLGSLIEEGQEKEARQLFESLRTQLGDFDPMLSGLQWELHDLELHGLDGGTIPDNAAGHQED